MDLSTEKEIAVLEHISDRTSRRENVQQRDLARIVGMSLGMTNAIIRRLARKGYLTIQKVNNRNIAYAVTPAGLEAIARRGYRYFRRTVKNIVLYKEAIEDLVLDIKRRGFRTIVLVGQSDLAFIVEHLAGKYGLCFVGVAELPETQEKDLVGRDGDGKEPHFVLYGEAEVGEQSHRVEATSLRTVLADKSR